MRARTHPDPGQRRQGRRWKWLGPPRRPCRIRRGGRRGRGPVGHGTASGPRRAVRPAAVQQRRSARAPLCPRPLARLAAAAGVVPPRTAALPGGQAPGHGLRRRRRRETGEGFFAPNFVHVARPSIERRLRCAVVTCKAVVGVVALFSGLSAASQRRQACVWTHLLLLLQQQRLQELEK